jgi:hypothetical protein
VSNDTIVQSIYLILLIVLVGSSLILRRLPHGKMLSLGATWLAIILGLWGLVIIVQKFA